MSAALITAALLVGLGDLALVVASWKSRTVLGGVLSAVGVALVGFAVVRGATVVSLVRVAPNPGSAHVDPAATWHELSLPSRLVRSSRGA